MWAGGNLLKVGKISIEDLRLRGDGDDCGFRHLQTPFAAAIETNRTVPALRRDLCAIRQRCRVSSRSRRKAGTVAPGSF